MEDVFRSTSTPAPNRYLPEQMMRSGLAEFGPRSLEMFVDLGLSDRQIARYFQTSETQIVSLRRRYGLS